MKKLLIIIAIIIVILGITGFVLYKIEEDKRIEQEEDAIAITFKDNLTVEFESKVKLSEFISNINGELIDDSYVDTIGLGEKEIEFQYVSQRNKIKTRKFNINIIDTVAPEVYMSNTMTVNIGDNKDIAYSVLSGDNCDPKPVRKIEGEYDVNNVGSYKLQYVITDASVNETRKDFTLSVVKKSASTKSTQREPIMYSECLSRYKNENTSLGIDVSKWQGNIDWKAVKNAGVEFAFIRIGYQTGFDADYNLDKYFEQNIKGANEAGVDVGIYFYSYARKTEDAISQVDWIYEKIKDYDVKLPIVFDWESWTSFPNGEMSFYDINNIAKTFINRAEKCGYKGMLYSSKNYLEKIWHTDEFENIWLAHYTNQTSYEGHYDFWQMCDTGRVDGINGAVDIDVWYRKS